MLTVLEIIKEASLRIPTKSSQTLGGIGGIVIGQAEVETVFASKVLIVLVCISTIPQAANHTFSLMGLEKGLRVCTPYPDLKRIHLQLLHFFYKVHSFHF